MHYKHCVDIPSILDVYAIAHANVYAKTWLSGDDKTKNVLANKEARELKKKRTGSGITMDAKAILYGVTDENTILTSATSMGNKEVKSHLKKVKESYNKK